MVDFNGKISSIQTINNTPNTTKNNYVSSPDTNFKGTELVDSCIGRDIISNPLRNNNVGKVIPRTLLNYGYQYGRSNVMSKIDYQNNIYKAAQFKENAPENYTVSKMGCEKDQVVTQKFPQGWSSIVTRNGEFFHEKFSDISDNTARILTDYFFDGYNVASQDDENVVLYNSNNETITINKSTGEIV